MSRSSPGGATREERGIRRSRTDRKESTAKEDPWAEEDGNYSYIIQQISATAGQDLPKSKFYDTARKQPENKRIMIIAGPTRGDYLSSPGQHHN